MRSKFKRYRFSHYLPHLLAFTFLLNVFLLIALARKPSAEENRQEHPVPRITQKPSVTAVLLSWKRLENVKKILRHYQTYEFISEIIIWNNNPEIILDEPELEFKEHQRFPHQKLRIYNSPENLYFLARYYACLMALNEVCLLQDDDWIVWPIRSLYHNYLRFPNVLHTDTNPEVHVYSWKWTFFNDEYNLHTGFSWVGTGAMVSKTNVRKFLSQLEALRVPPDTSIYADMYFSTWFNSVPYQLENDLEELDQSNSFTGNEGEERRVEGIKRNWHYMWWGVKTMVEELKKNSGVFNTENTYPDYHDRDVRAPCWNDWCLFISNVKMLPNPESVKYTPDMNIPTVEDTHSAIFNPTHFLEHPYHKAVDNDERSYWHARGIHAGSYFGLDLFETKAHHAIRLKVGHKNQRHLELFVSTDAVTWVGKWSDN